MDFSFIAIIHNALYKIKLSRATLKVWYSFTKLHGVRFGEECTVVRPMDGQRGAEWFDNSQRKDFILHSVYTSCGAWQTFY